MRLRSGFAVSVVVLLALGIGAGTAMFSVVDTVLLKPLPYPDAERLVALSEVDPKKSESLIAPGRLEDWQRLNRTFAGIAGAYAENVTDTGGAEPVRLAGLRVSPRYFDVYGMRAAVGRTFVPEDVLAVVVSDALRRRGYEVGRRLTIGGQGFTVVGAMPREFSSGATEVWLPANVGPGLLQAREARFFSGMGRMKPGVTAAQAAEDLSRVQFGLGEQYPKTDKGWSAAARDLKETRVGDSRRALWLLFCAVGMVLAILVTNVAGLFLAEWGRRDREFGIRISVGATRWQLIGGVTRAAGRVALMGAAGGWLLAWLGVGAVKRLFADVPRVGQLEMDWRALTFAMGVGLVSALAFGLLPGLHMTAMRRRGGRQWLRRGMVAGQIALTMALVAGGGMLVKSFYELSHVDSGFDAGHTVVFHVGAAWDEDRDRVGMLQERMIGELGKIPGVVAVGITNFLPATGASMRYTVKVDGGRSEALGFRTISPGYLRALSVPLLSGHACPELRLDWKAPRRAVVNRRFRETFGDARNVDGAEIIGVVGDVREDALAAPAAPYVYTCAMGGYWPDPEYVVRAGGDVRAAIREVARRVDGTRAVFGMKTLQEAVDGDLERPRSNARMVAGFGLAALALAAVGLYGLMARMVSARRKEIGLRMALGAGRGSVVGLVMAQAGMLAAVGIGVGAAVALGGQKILGSFFTISGRMDFEAVAGAAALLGLVALFAAVWPARRAASIDPMEALRVE